MIKRDRIDVECVRAFVAAHTAETKVEPLPERCSKEKAHNIFLQAIKALDKNPSVAMCEHRDDTDPKAGCGAVSPNDCECCPYCGGKFDDDKPGDIPENKALVRNDGDKLVPILTRDKMVAQIREKLAGSAEHIWQAGLLLKAARDTSAYKPATWDDFCEKECGISTATAGNFIRVVEAYPNHKDLPKIPMRDLYMIVSVPQEHREELQKKIEENADGKGRAEVEAKVKEIRAKVHPQQSAGGKKSGKAATLNSVKCPDPTPVLRKGTKVKSDADCPLVTVKIGDRLKAKWLDPEGKRLQLGDVVKKGGTASFAIGRHCRVVVSITNDGAILTVRGDDEK